MEEAKNSAADKLEVESTLRMFEDREAKAPTESAKAYTRAGRDLCRAAHGVEPIGERALRGVAHAGTWEEQRAEFIGNRASLPC